MSSLNHTMLMGDVVQWAFERLGGLRPHAPGFRQVANRPALHPATGYGPEAEHLAPTGALRLRCGPGCQIDRDRFGHPARHDRIAAPAGAGGPHPPWDPGRHAYSVPG